MTDLTPDQIREQLQRDLIDKYGSIKKAITATGVPSSTLRSFLNGTYVLPSEGTRIKLYETTGFEYLSEPFKRKDKVKVEKTERPIENKLETQLRNAHTSIENIRSVIIHSNNTGEIDKAQARQSLILSDDQRAKRAAELFYAFISEVQGFPENSRTKFTQLVSEQDAGYLISVVNYVYNPDKFKSWIGKSNYTPTNKR